MKNSSISKINVPGAKYSLIRAGRLTAPLSYYLMEQTTICSNQLKMDCRNFNSRRFGKINNIFWLDNLNYVDHQTTNWAFWQCQNTFISSSTRDMMAFRLDRIKHLGSNLNIRNLVWGLPVTLTWMRVGQTCKIWYLFEWFWNTQLCSDYTDCVSDRSPLPPSNDDILNKWF